jgi:hypothetical protein
MLAVPADRLPAALADLDPGNRALLDLSLRRGVSDAEIGELLRKDPDEVARGRDAVLELLADALEVGGDDRRERVRRAIVELPEATWRARPAPAAAPLNGSDTQVSAPDADLKREPETREPAREPVDRPAEPRPVRDGAPLGPPAERRRRGRWIAFLALLVAAGVAVALLAGGGDEERDSPEPTPGAGEQADPRDGAEPEPRAAGRRATFAAVGGGEGGGRITVREDGRVVISVEGLRAARGAYVAWLFDDVANARLLGTIDPESGRLTTRLPARAARYRFVDVSREPGDGNPNHSGESVLRAPVAKLLDD